MKRIAVFCFFLFFAFFLLAQSPDSVFSAGHVAGIERILAADDMQGRAVGTPGIEKAAAFISGQFKIAGIHPWSGDSYRQPFSMIRNRIISAEVTVDGNPLDSQHIIVFSNQTDLELSDQSGYGIEFIHPGESLGRGIARLSEGSKDLIVLVDPSLASGFGRLSRRPHMRQDHNLIFLLYKDNPKTYSIRVHLEAIETRLANIVGILPGKTRKDEFVIFSAHYDHLGIGPPNAAGDSIFNGANDDASGCTAVMTLARYFSQRKDNERTLVFATFTAEEIGEYGSQYFSQQMDPQKVVAMFNIEMIGTESKWGANSAYITGFDRSDMGNILEKNLAGSDFRFYPDPYPEQQLFYRSDNASLARQGVPAHTISTSKMDSEKFYHTLGDEIGTLDMENIARIIRSIAISAVSIVEGRDTPSRVDSSQLR